MRSRRGPFNINIKILKSATACLLNTWHMWFKLRVGEKTKRTNREDYCNPKKVQLSSKPPASRLRKKRSRKLSQSVVRRRAFGQTGLSLYFQNFYKREWRVENFCRPPLDWGPCYPREQRCGAELPRRGYRCDGGRRWQSRGLISVPYAAQR